MKAPYKRRARWMVGFTVAMLFNLFISAQAQNSEQQQTAPDTTQTQINQVDQMLGPLNLTPDQTEKIRLIYADLEDQRQAANFRLRLAQRALTQTIESAHPDERLIEQRSKEFSEAQANLVRLRSLRQARIWQVLRPDQRLKLRELQQINQANIRRRNQRLQQDGNQQLPRNALRPRQGGLQRNSNANAPLTPKQRRIMRQQQRP